MLRVTTRLRFIEPQLASPVDHPPEGKHWIHEIKHDGYRSMVVVERGEARVYTGMDLIGASVIPPSFAPLPISDASQRSLMVRPLSRMTTVHPILRHYGRQCDGSRKASSCTPSIFCTSMARTCGNKPS